MLNVFLDHLQVSAMLRMAVVSYLMIATLAGQAWCCCLLDTLPISSFVSGSDNVTDDAPAPARSCCCHQQTSSEEPATNPTKSEQPKAPRENCPCKDQRSNENLPVTPEIYKQELQARGALGFVEYLQAIHLNCLMTDSCVHAIDKGHDLTRPYYLTGPDLLCALQVYRC
jgi:hypothetical protein